MSSNDGEVWPLRECPAGIAPDRLEASASRSARASAEHGHPLPVSLRHRHADACQWSGHHPIRAAPRRTHDKCRVTRMGGGRLAEGRPAAVRPARDGDRHITTVDDGQVPAGLARHQCQGSERQGERHQSTGDPTHPLVVGLREQRLNPTQACADVPRPALLALVAPAYTFDHCEHVWVGHHHAIGHVPKIRVRDVRLQV